ncbi:hypothetical protein [Reyranella sp.]|uniref:hypothetical protein n=1 Tax=Reyranella sp. TaxID=1929291 RepID=UPI003F71B769
MSLHWTIDPQARLFHTVCEGNVEGHEVHAMLDALLEARALGYRKLFDGTRGETRMSAMEIIDIGVRMRSLHKGDVELGPLAIAITDDKYVLLGRVLGMLAAPRRPMRIFKTAKLAYRWLNSPAILASLPELQPMSASQS